MPKQATRRFIGLTTEEVSLVDSPANEVEFLVVKNTEDPSMGATAKANKEVVPVEVDGDENVTKALAHVNGIVEKIAGLVQTNKEAKPPTAPADGGDQSGDDDTETDEGADTEDVAKSLKSVLQACGMDKSMMKTVMTKLKAAGFSAGNMPAGKPPEDGAQKTSKTKGGDDEPLTMATLASAVQKAAVFTPGRIQSLQQAQEILKLVLEAVTPGTSPDASTPAVGTFANTSAVADLTKPNTKPNVPTMKAADEELVKTLKGLAEGLAGVNSRLEAIEKGRPASNSVDPDGATDTGTKKSASIWSGVL